MAYEAFEKVFSFLKFPVLEAADEFSKQIAGEFYRSLERLFMKGAFVFVV